MGRPYGLLRAGFPFHKTLGMRRLTNFPIDLAIGQEDRLYILCRSEGNALIRRYSTEDKDLGNFGSYGSEPGEMTWPVTILADGDENLYLSDEALHRVTINAGMLSLPHKPGLGVALREEVLNWPDVRIEDGSGAE